MVKTWIFLWYTAKFHDTEGPLLAVSDDGHIADIVKEFSIDWFHKTFDILYTKLRFLDQFLENWPDSE